MDDTFAYEGVKGEIWLIEEEWGSWLVAEPEKHGPGCRGLSRQHPCYAQQPGQRSQGLLAVRRLEVPGRDLYCCTQLLLSYLVFSSIAHGRGSRLSMANASSDARPQKRSSDEAADPAREALAMEAMEGDPVPLHGFSRLHQPPGLSSWTQAQEGHSMIYDVNSPLFRSFLTTSGASHSSASR